MEKLEQFIYEAKPYISLGFGIYALSADNPSKLAIGCALLLLFAAMMILRMRFKSRRGSPLESLFYESQPYLYLGIAGYALMSDNPSKLAIGSALLLMFCGIMILQWRYRSRRS